MSLQETAYVRCNQVETLIDYFILMPVTYCHDPIFSIRQMIDD